MNKTLPFLIIALFFNIHSSLAQENNPKSYVGSDGKLYWNKSVPAYFWIGSKPDKPEHKLESEATPKYANPHYFDTEGVNFIRSRDAFDPETQRIIEPRIEVLYEIYVDGIAPSSQLTLENATIFKSGETVYYGPGLIANITSKDAVAGVEKINLNVNNEGYKPYTSPVNLTKEGNFTLQYYATDSVGNSEASRAESFILDISAPVSNLNINGLLNDNVISIGSKMYILNADNLSGVKETFFSFNEGPFAKYNNLEVNFKTLNEGEHKISYYSVDNVGNKEEPKSFSFFFDKTGPLMAADILGDRFIAGEQVYFSGRTKLKLTAVDNKVGVKEIRYSVDNAEFAKYEQPFYLPSVSGVHSVRYYSIDNMDNQSIGEGKSGFEEFKHSVNKVYVDLTGPTVSHTVLGTSLVRNDTVLIGPNNSIRLTASDKESGLKSIFYSLNDAHGETSYEQPIVIAKEGTHKLEYFAYDNVNNRNLADFTFNVDATPPTIYFQFTVGSVGKEKGLDVYPSSSGLFIVGTDEKAGLQQIFYSLNGAAEKPYLNLITGLKKGTDHKVKARAVDNLGNSSTSEITFYIQK